VTNSVVRNALVVQIVLGVQVALDVLAVQIVLRVLVLIVLGSAVVQAQSDTRGFAIPTNIQAGLLTQDIVALIQASPTFRAQCERIAASRTLRVHVEVVRALDGPRAETTITRYEAGALRAHVRIAFGHDYRELIAHEFEHIIEQLDSVDLRSEAEHGRAWLLDANAFETRRASEAGRRVRREYEADTHASLTLHPELR
jgi:hypothetical protein